MFKIVHRINTVEKLKNIPPEYGVEVDIRACNDRIILHHDAFKKGEDFEEYLEYYKHAFIILNIKETGIEQRVLDLINKKGITDYFLLDVEFPYIYKSTRNGKQKIAVRYSEAEPIEQAILLKDLVEWVWIDVNTKLPIDTNIKEQMKGFKTCLVSPECWGRPHDIVVYKKRLQELDFKIDAVMSDWQYIDQWN